MEVFDEPFKDASFQNTIVEFTFENQEIRTIKIDDQIWFVATDVCRVLGLTDVSAAVNPLDDDEKGKISTRTLGGNQKLWAVNEYGLYNLIFSSRLPKAKSFRRWVLHEVIPAIRKTGSYEANKGEEKLEPEAKNNKVFVGVPGPGHYQIIVYETGCTFLEVPDCDSTRLDHILLNLDVFCYTVKQIEAIWTKLRLTHQSLCDHDQTPDAARMNNSVTDASALATELLQR
jgi:prophage antirepressor-like protein